MEIIIKCPNCNSKYCVETELLKNIQKVQCSVCYHTWEYKLSPESSSQAVPHSMTDQFAKKKGYDEYYGEYYGKYASESYRIPERTLDASLFNEDRDKLSGTNDSEYPENYSLTKNEPNYTQPLPYRKNYTQAESHTYITDTHSVDKSLDKASYEKSLNEDSPPEHIFPKISDEMITATFQHEEIGTIKRIRTKPSLLKLLAWPIFFAAICNAIFWTIYFSGYWPKIQTFVMNNLL